MTLQSGHDDVNFLFTPRKSNKGAATQPEAESDDDTRPKEQPLAANFYDLEAIESSGGESHSELDARRTKTSQHSGTSDGYPTNPPGSPIIDDQTEDASDESSSDDSEEIHSKSVPPSHRALAKSKAQPEGEESSGGKDAAPPRRGPLPAAEPEEMEEDSEGDSEAEVATSTAFLQHASGGEDPHDADQSEADGEGDDIGLLDSSTLSPKAIPLPPRRKFIAYAEDSDDLASAPEDPAQPDGNAEESDVISNDSREPRKQDASDIEIPSDVGYESPQKDDDIIQWPENPPSPSPRGSKRVLSSGESPPRKFNMTNRATASRSEHDICVNVDIPSLEPLSRRKPQLPDRAVYFNPLRRR